MHWISPNEGATNESGFTALPGGYCRGGGYFRDVGYYGYWWSATESSGGINAWYRYMKYASSNVSRNDLNTKEDGFSVRCVKD